jgi:oxygen-independent coproporphyrinogen-3 oxidase
MERLSLYLHIPFCQRRCGYCDFNTYAGLDDLIPPYVDALAAEIFFYGEKNRIGKNLPVHTVYFGGGTPSLLSEGQLGRLLGDLDEAFQLEEDCEITIEANPGTVDLEYFQKIREYGVNRISLGVQSAISGELAVLDRLHGYEEAEQAVEQAREAGFENTSLDLINGIPGQTLNSWQESLDAALSLSPQHLSLYSLTVERGTPLEGMIQSGLVQAPNDDLAADMYELACKKLDQLGYRHYEISNWGLVLGGEVMVSRHNRQYWRNHPYIGLGAGAHGFLGGIRYQNVRGIPTYINGMKKVPEDGFPGVAEDIEKIDHQREMNETLMMGLRLLEEGVSTDGFSARFGENLEDVYGVKIGNLIGLGLLEWIEGEKRSIRLTSRGYLLGNRVFGEFV